MLIGAKVVKFTTLHLPYIIQHPPLPRMLIKAVNFQQQQLLSTLNLQTSLAANLGDLSVGPDDSLHSWHLHHPMVLEMSIQIVCSSLLLC
jgi:hypothetical protein